MINRIFGVLFTLVALSIITLATYNFGNYRSIFFDKEAASMDVIVEEAVVVDEAIPQIDSLKVVEMSVPSDSLKIASEVITNEQLEELQEEPTL